MTYDLLLALVLFYLGGVDHAGAQQPDAHGIRRQFRLSPHGAAHAGHRIGGTLMVLLVGIGLASVFAAVPVLHQVLKAVSIVYLLWLAWKIAHAAPVRSGSEQGRPMTFLQAAAFQWVNPKAWTMAITVTTAYALGQTAAAMAMVALTFGVVSLPAITTWTLAGQQLTRFLTSPARLSAFNWTMAALLVASLIPVLLP